jgi:hypothetical protein
LVVLTGGSGPVPAAVGTLDVVPLPGAVEVRGCDPHVVTARVTATMAATVAGVTPGFRPPQSNNQTVGSLGYEGPAARRAS